MIRTFFLAAIVAAAAAQSLAAQAPPGPADAPTAGEQATAVGATAAKVSALYVVPEIPANSFLGGATATITRPTTPKDFAVALAEGVDEQGRAKRGFALEASLFSIVPGFQITLEKYRTNYFDYVLSNLLLSFGTVAAASGDSSATDIAYGVRSTLYDAGDPMRDTAFIRVLGQGFLACAPDQPISGVPRPGEAPLPADVLTELRKQRRETTLACMDLVSDTMSSAYARDHWNATRISVAFAGGETLTESSFSDRAHIGERLWIVAALQLGSFAQVIGYGDYTNRSGSEQKPAYNAYTYGGRFNIGTEGFNGFYERLAQKRSDTSPGVDENANAWSLGIEARAASGLWLSGGFGDRFQELARPDKVMVFANIKWGISTKPWLKP